MVINFLLTTFLILENCYTAMLLLACYLYMAMNESKYEKQTEINCPISHGLTKYALAACVEHIGV